MDDGLVEGGGGLALVDEARTVSFKPVGGEAEGIVCLRKWGASGGVIRENRSKVAGLLQCTVIPETELQYGTSGSPHSPRREIQGSPRSLTLYAQNIIYRVLEGRCSDVSQMVSHSAVESGHVTGRKDETGHLPIR